MEWMKQAARAVHSPKADKARHTSRKAVSGIIRFVFLFGFCYVILHPVLSMILKTFMDKADLLDNSVLLIPKTFTFENVKAAAMTLKYAESFINTTVITLTTTLLQVFSCMLIGYGFARHEFPMKNLLFALVIFTLIVPPQIFNIPYYQMFRSLGLINSYVPFWVLAVTGMGVKNGLFIYLFRQSFKNMPMELEEAGTIDGCTSIGIFLKIMVPNLITVIVTVVLFSIVWQYNDVTYTRIFFSGERNFSTAYAQLYTVTDQVREFLGYALEDVRITAYYPLLKSAGTCIMMLPLIGFYLLAQRFFVQGVERSGIVG